DERNGPRVLAQVDGEQIAATDLTCVDPHVRKVIDVREDRHLRAGRLTARRAGHTAQHPFTRAARADQSSLAGEEGLAGVGEERELRKPAAARAPAVVAFG